MTPKRFRGPREEGLVGPPAPVPAYIEALTDGEKHDDAAVLWAQWWRAFNDPHPGAPMAKVKCKHCGRYVGEVRAVDGCVVLGSPGGGDSYSSFRLIHVEGPKTNADAARAASDISEAGLCGHHAGDSPVAQVRLVSAAIARRRTRVKV